jgi:hypothetical protein
VVKSLLRHSPQTEDSLHTEVRAEPPALRETIASLVAAHWIEHNDQTPPGYSLRYGQRRHDGSLRSFEHMVPAGTVWKPQLGAPAPADDLMLRRGGKRRLSDDIWNRLGGSGESTPPPTPPAAEPPAADDAPRPKRRPNPLDLL